MFIRYYWNLRSVVPNPDNDFRTRDSEPFTDWLIESEEGIEDSVVVERFKKTFGHELDTIRAQLFSNDPEGLELAHESLSRRIEEDFFVS